MAGDEELVVVAGDIEYTALPQRKRRRGAAAANANAAAATAEGEAAAGAAAESGGEAAPAQAIAEQREEYKFEYLDHTADVQLHSWGATLEEAFEGNVLAMFNYMTPLDDDVLRNDVHTARTFSVSAHDMHSLLFAFLDETLFVFASEQYVPTNIKVTKLDRDKWVVEATASGVKYVDGKHLQGTEVKAITYSAMKVEEKDERADVWVIVDI